jgi:hypothetical protein
MGLPITRMIKSRKNVFLPSNYRLNLVLAQNRKSLTIQLSKPFKFGHQVVFMGDFKIFIYDLVLRS